MKIITLAVPTVVDGVLRNPIEGALTTSDAEAERLKDNGLLDGEPEDLPVPDDDEAAPKKRGTPKPQDTPPAA